VCAIPVGKVAKYKKELRGKKIERGNRLNKTRKGEYKCTKKCRGPEGNHNKGSGDVPDH